MAENFIVSARKYRPQSWDTVVGQRSITTTLQNAIANGQIAQAYLFTGPRGVGKTTCARIFAKAVNGMLDLEMDDLQFSIFELDAASNNSVDDIRSIVDTVRIPPQVGKYKVYIIDEVHMLSASAFNAFLKTLEEPPAHAIFILATTEKHKIIPTILSRCQIFDFARIKVRDMTEHLASIATKEGITAEPAALHIIAQKADGAMRDALSIFDQVVAFCGKNLKYQDVIQNLNVLDYDYYFRLTDMISSEDIPAALVLFDEVLNKGFDGHHFISGLGEHFRNLLVCRDAVTVQLMEVSDDVAEKYKVQAAASNVQFLIKSLDFINTCDVQYRASKNQRLLVELTLMQLCSIPLNQREGEKKKYRLKGFRVNGHPDSNREATGKKQLPTSKAPVANSQPVHSPKAAQVPVFVETDMLSAVNEPMVPFVKKSLMFGTETPSIKRMLQKPQDKKVEESQEELATDTTHNQGFNHASFELVWQEFADGLRERNGSLHSTLKSEVRELAEDGTITLQLSNSVQAIDVEAVRGALLDFLKRKLHNSTFKLQWRIQEQQERKMSMKTPKEKFDEMVKKNPALETLRNKFKLQIDF
ncbi:MAG: DNA polymerase III subunit gamma/tau [Flavobacteriales bacterium]|nr:DNA polymerase III subunit gamma/tau [Flavobacteriales bacterium]